MALEILQFYVSGFWVWLGITAGIGVTLNGLALIFAALASFGGRE